jgi:hypothetical protein
MPVLLNFGIEFAMGLLVSCLVASWFIWPFLRSRTFTTALLILLAPSLVRYMGLMTFVPGVVDPAVTRSQFAFYQAWGDFGAFVLVLVAMALVRRRHPLALAAVWVFNLFGTADFVQAVLRGALGEAGGSLGAFWYIPVAYVPFALVVHVMIFVHLIKRSGEFVPRGAERTA